MIDVSDDRTGPAEAAILRTLFEKISIWVPFIYSRFPARLASSFLALSLVALGCVLAAEWKADDAQHASSGERFGAILNPTDVQQQRDAVLMQIVAYRRPN
jgi:hypothetical protein